MVKLVVVVLLYWLFPSLDMEEETWLVAVLSLYPCACEAVKGHEASESD